MILNHRLRNLYFYMVIIGTTKNATNTNIWLTSTSRYKKLVIWLRRFTSQPLISLNHLGLKRMISTRMVRKLGLESLWYWTNGRKLSVNPLWMKLTKTKITYKSFKKLKWDDISPQLVGCSPISWQEESTALLCVNYQSRLTPRLWSIDWHFHLTQSDRYLSSKWRSSRMKRKL